MKFDSDHRMDFSNIDSPVKFNLHYFLHDKAVKWSVARYNEYLADKSRYEERRDLAIRNMTLILRAYGLDALVRPEEILEKLNRGGYNNGPTPDECGHAMTGYSDR